MLQETVGIAPLSLLANSTLMKSMQRGPHIKERSSTAALKKQIPSTVTEPVNNSSLSWERQSSLELARHPNINE